MGGLEGEVLDYLLPLSLPTMNCMLALLPTSSCKMSSRLPKVRVLPVRTISQSRFYSHIKPSNQDITKQNTESGIQHKYKRDTWKLGPRFFFSFCYINKKYLFILYNLCVRGIDFISFCNFNVWTRNYYHIVIYFYFFFQFYCKHHGMAWCTVFISEVLHTSNACMPLIVLCIANVIQL